MNRIVNIGTFSRNNWIVDTPKGIIAVDTGMANDTAKFLNRFGRQWALDKLKYIFLTHAHNDHAGFVGELLKRTNAIVVLCETSRRIIEIGHPNEKHEYVNWIGKLLERAMASRIGAYPAVTDKNRMRIVSDGDCFFEELGIPARVVFLPGHSTDSIGLFLYEDRALFCGDAAMNIPFLNANRHTVLIEHRAEFRASWEKALSLNPSIIYPGHGKPFPAADLKKYINWRKMNLRSD
jgi:glyoxylase-like metal-dependent hydrolase (beta-lactamase superfamily II)